MLEEKPTRPHLELAELRIGDSWLSFGSLQRKILNRAATLGADAVVFAKPETQTQHEVAYEPLYHPWGYNSPYYGIPGGYIWVWCLWGLWRFFWIVGSVGWRLLRQRRGSLRRGHVNAHGNSHPLYGSDRL